jgi:hypothetical protein
LCLCLCLVMVHSIWCLYYVGFCKCVAGDAWYICIV